jgi:hypothetical protein
MDKCDLLDRLCSALASVYLSFDILICCFVSALVTVKFSMHIVYFAISFIFLKVSY